MKFVLCVFCLLAVGCAKNSRDIVNEGKTIGFFEPKRDYVVDIPMRNEKVSGQASGVKILGIFTIGAGSTAEGVQMSNRGNSTLGGSTHSTSAFSAFSPALAMLPESTEEKFKAAALRDACDKNNCDVLGYAMYDVDSTNFFLFKTYDVSVKGFPGNVESLENVNRSYSPSNSYWRRHSWTDGAYSPNSMPYSDSKWRQSLRSSSGK